MKVNITGIHENIACCTGSAGAGFIFICTNIVTPIMSGHMPIISMVGGASIGFVIGQAFDGTLAPLTLGYLISGLVALAIVLAAEKGRLFAAHNAPGADAPPGLGH